MRRLILGLIALVLLVAGAVMLSIFGVSDDRQSMIASICLRAGLVFAAIWLAYPQVQRISRSISPVILGLFALGILIIVVRAKLIFIVGPVLLAMILLHIMGVFLRKPPPRHKKKRRAPAQEDEPVSR